MSDTPALTLQDLLNGIKRDASELGETIDRLEAENDKLLELASGLNRCLDFEGCEGCPMQDDDGWCVRDIRLREMGVEVGQ